MRVSARPFSSASRSRPGPPRQSSQWPASGAPSTWNVARARFHATSPAAAPTSIGRNDSPLASADAANGPIARWTSPAAESAAAARRGAKLASIPVSVVERASRLAAADALVGQAALERELPPGVGLHAVEEAGRLLVVGGAVQLEQRLLDHLAHRLVAVLVRDLGERAPLLAVEDAPPQRLLRRGGRRLARQHARDVLRADRVGRVVELAEEALERVAQLADVARPRFARQRGERVRGDAREAGH